MLLIDSRWYWVAGWALCVGQVIGFGSEWNADISYLTTRRWYTNGMQRMFRVNTIALTTISTGMFIQCVFRIANGAFHLTRIDHQNLFHLTIVDIVQISYGSFRSTKWKSIDQTFAHGMTKLSSFSYRAINSIRTFDERCRVTKWWDNKRVEFGRSFGDFFRQASTKLRKMSDHSWDCEETKNYFVFVTISNSNDHSK